MRSRLTRDLRLRVAPFLRFHIDEQVKKEMAVLDLLEQVRRENEELDRKRAEAAAAAAADPGAAPPEEAQAAAGADTMVPAPTAPTAPAAPAAPADDRPSSPPQQH
jgi:hypothetical protein